MQPSRSGPDAARLLADPALPAPVRRFLESGGQLEHILLDEQGQWSHQGEPFTNPALIALFNRSLVRTAADTWLLHIPPFSYPVELADTPYFVRSARRGGEAVILGLFDDSEEPLVPATLSYVEGRGLYCRVKAGSAPDFGYAARLLRPAYFVLADCMRPAGEGSEGFVLELGSKPPTLVPMVSWERARRSGSAGPFL